MHTHTHTYTRDGDDIYGDFCSGETDRLFFVLEFQVHRDELGIWQENGEFSADWNRFDASTVARRFRKIEVNKQESFAFALLVKVGKRSTEIYSHRDVRSGQSKKPVY